MLTEISDIEPLKKIYESTSEADIFLKNKRILITGAAGSIGSALIASLIEKQVDLIRALDYDESRLAALYRRHYSRNLEQFLCDIRDLDCVTEAVKDIDIVFHAAALKHVPLSEYFPLEYIRTNVDGTYNLLKASSTTGVKKFILISTDKAVNPTNVMGATKLLAEKLVIAFSLNTMNRGMASSVVRFGNVLYTRGSVLEIFMEQIKHGGPITITEPNMTRFIMSVTQATDLVLKAATLSRGGEIFVLKMPAVRIIDLAKAFIDIFAEKFGYNPSDIKIQTIGRRPGEKMHEELMTELESQHAIDLGEFYVILPEMLLAKYRVSLNWVQRPTFRYSSDTTEILDLETIKKLLIDFSREYDFNSSDR